MLKGLLSTSRNFHQLPQKPAARTVTHKTGHLREEIEGLGSQADTPWQVASETLVCAMVKGAFQPPRVNWVIRLTSPHLP